MKYLKKYENKFDNVSILIEYITEKYFKNVYGWYNYIIKEHVGVYIIKLAFVNFDKSASKALDKLSEYLHEDWDMGMEKLNIDTDDDTDDDKVFMVVTYYINSDDVDKLVKDINLNKTINKYNL